MGDSSQRSTIESTIAELDDVLRAATPSAAVRELRVRHGALARVVRAWSGAGPHSAQLSAMMECVLELRDAVRKACPVRPRDTAVNGKAAASRPPARPTARAIPAKAMKSTRPPPRRTLNKGTTRPPPRAARSGAPPSSRRG